MEKVNLKSLLNKKVRGVNLATLLLAGILFGLVTISLGITTYVVEKLQANINSTEAQDIFSQGLSGLKAFATFLSPIAYTVAGAIMMSIMIAVYLIMRKQSEYTQ
ncbi:MAG: hypothetical protein DRP00_03340 [Candidatus Aenigmatarchaeota archaeon]|nr:MAG: hypothetical protein DRP00_03340 [Candidatus Aenigmarchaeota archaeon]